MITEKQRCDRCGSCCQQGGPALHSQDLALIESKSLLCEHLVTVRRGELAYQPQEQTATPVVEEFLKLQGKSGSWCCLFYDDAAKSCTIYNHRPVACGLLDCTSPEALLAITGKDLLTRFDCMRDDNPLLPLIRQHEQDCPCPDMTQLSTDLQSTIGRASLLDKLTLLVNTDLSFRPQASIVQNLSVAEELFYFGRPLFQQLLPLGIRIQESSTGLQLY
jgi:hypothetical protein